MAFNKQAALDAGYSEQEINEYLAGKKTVTQPKKQKASEGGSLLSPELIGSIIGGKVGSVGGPIGRYAGAGFGASTARTIADPSQENMVNLLGQAFPPARIVGLMREPGQMPELDKSARSGMATQLTGDILSRLLNPFKLVGEIRNVAANTSQGNVAGDAVMNTVRNARAPVSDQAAFEKLLVEAEKRFGGGKTFSIPEALQEKTLAGHAARTARGQVGRSADAFFEEQVRKALQGQIAEQAPAVSMADKGFETLYSGKRLLERFLGPIIIGTIMRGATGGGGSF